MPLLSLPLVAVLAIFLPWDDLLRDDLLPAARQYQFGVKLWGHSRS